jgi:hypothetical protein
MAKPGNCGINCKKSKEDSGIISIGPKVASLYLRDLVTMLSLQHKVSSKDQVFLQPVDTWVSQITKKIGIEETTDEEIRMKIIERCKLANESAIKFNEGVWYLGTHSLTILLEMLQRD